MSTIVSSKQLTVVFNDGVVATIVILHYVASIVVVVVDYFVDILFIRNYIIKAEAAKG